MVRISALAHNLWRDDRSIDRFKEDVGGVFVGGLCGVVFVVVVAAAPAALCCCSLLLLLSLMKDDDEGRR